jgi:3-dehydroquinate dehydratase/shikimate dehydrogenase
MAKICLCLTAKTIARDLDILAANRQYIDLVELRVDCLDSDERFSIRRFPEMAGVPVILTIRRKEDGGKYIGGEGARVTLLSEGLAFAESDPRKNFAYVDLEEDLYVPSLIEAARSFGTRIIRSWHNTTGTDRNLVQRMRALRRTGDEIVKAAVTPQGVEDVIRVYQAAKELKDMNKILLCMGDYGVNTRVLAERMGSFLSYTTAKAAKDAPSAAPGQIDARKLAELYRFRELRPDATVYGVTGNPVTQSSSPLFFNTVFGIEKTDAVYVPFPADNIDAMLRLAENLGIRGLSVTAPYKEAVLPYLSFRSDRVKAIGACNTLVASPRGWMGYNTDAEGFSESLLNFVGRKNLSGRRITIVGAGGAARAVAEEVARLKGRACILNRTSARARELALRYRFEWGGLDSEGLEMIDRYDDIIIQTTSAGMEGSDLVDPLEFYRFSGKEMVMDLIYKPRKTKFLRRAEEAGCKIQNGYDMLLRQARLQYRFFMAKDFPPSLITRVGMEGIDGQE